MLHKYWGGYCSLIGMSVSSNWHYRSVVAGA
jgi:hypothetical protein